MLNIKRFQGFNFKYQKENDVFITKNLISLDISRSVC